MEWTETLNRAIGYLEENLLENVTCEEAAAQVHLSPFHFQRAFSLMTGISIREYVRNRRLSLAGQELMRDGCKVFDTALRYGYETPESFTKAFRRFHGVSPQQAKQLGTKLKNFPRLTVKIILEGGIAMDYKVENKPALSIVLTTRPFTEETSSAGIPKFWGEYRAAGLMKKVCGQFGICLQKDDPADKEWRYGIGSDARFVDGVPEGFSVMELPALTWAVFPCKGPMPHALQALWKRVYSEWLPQSGYELLPECDIEYYTAGDTGSPDYYSEIWLPVKVKEGQE